MDDVHLKNEELIEKVHCEELSFVENMLSWNLRLRNSFLDFHVYDLVI